MLPGTVPEDLTITSRPRLMGGMLATTPSDFSKPLNPEGVIAAPAPVQYPELPASEMPPIPDHQPEGHVIGPGEPITVVGKMRDGVLVTTVRHYRRFLPANSRRWSYVLLYPAGHEVYDRNIKPYVATEQVAALAAAGE